MNGHPKVFNIEADPREEHNIGANATERLSNPPASN
jgi:hypothetical protein